MRFNRFSPPPPSAHYSQALAVGVTTGTATRRHFEAQRSLFRPRLVIDGLGELLDSTGLGSAQ